MQMSFIALMKNILKPLKNRLYSLSLYLQNYGDNDVRLNGANLRKVKIRIKGSGNKIYIESTQTIENSIIDISANRSIVYILGGYASNLNIMIMDDGSSVMIGNKTTINGAEFWVTEGKDITVGEDCMFAKNIELRTGDNHAIFQSGKRLNKGGSISIGNHVWVGANAKIMKGVVIPFGSIIGNASLVTKVLEEENAIYVGIPARLIKSNICWYGDKKYRLLDRLSVNIDNNNAVGC